MLQAVADGWARKHPGKPKYVKLELIRDTTTLVKGRVEGPPAPEVLATWQVRRMKDVANWFTATIALARIAWLRTILYLFVILDMHAFVRDTRLKGEHPGLYQPLFLARLFDLPKPSVANTTALYFVLIVACLIGAANRFPRLAGWVVAPAFTWWVLIGMSDGKVDHDHLALVVALWVLPTRRRRPSRGRPVRGPDQVGGGRVGGPVCADLGDRDVLPVGGRQAPRRRLDAGLAGQRDPDLGDRAAAASGRGVAAASPVDAARDAVGRDHRRVPVAGRSSGSRVDGSCSGRCSSSGSTPRTRRSC